MARARQLNPLGQPIGPPVPDFLPPPPPPREPMNGRYCRLEPPRPATDLMMIDNLR